MKIVQVVRYVEMNHQLAEGSVVLADDGVMYRAEWGTTGPCSWQRLIGVPDLPNAGTLTLVGKRR